VAERGGNKNICEALCVHRQRESNHRTTFILERTCKKSEGVIHTEDVGEYKQSFSFLLDEHNTGEMEG